MYARADLFTLTRAAAMLAAALYGVLEVSTLGRTREGYDITDVLHARDEEDEALEAESEACMWAGAITACVEIPPQFVSLHVAVIDLCHEFVVTLLTD